MISFFRFATCPMCNMRMHELVTRWEEFHNDFEIVAVFDSPIHHLARHMEKHDAPFPILADEDRIFYDRYGVQHSMMGVVKGVLFRPATLLRSVQKGFIPTSVQGDLTTMPAEFLVDSGGVIQRAFYGKDEGDHLDFEVVKSFSHQAVASHSG